MPTEYTVEVAYSVEVLAGAVNKKLADGWTLYGTPFVGGTRHDQYCQALVRYDERAERMPLVSTEAMDYADVA